MNKNDLRWGVTLALFALITLAVGFLTGAIDRYNNRISDLEEIVYYDPDPTPEVQIIEKEVYIYPSEPDEYGMVAPWSPEEVDAVCKCVKGEAGGCDKLQRSGVVWCILNRVDDEQYPDNIMEVVTQKNQFQGYNKNNTYDENIRLLVEDVLWRWYMEKANGSGSYGRTLPSDYLYFVGDGKVNHFTKVSGGTHYWDWSLENPYEE